MNQRITITLMTIRLLTGLVLLSLGSGIHAKGTPTATPAIMAEHGAGADRPATADGEVTELQPLDCSQEAALKSIDSRNLTAIRFVNETAGTVRIYWLDYESQRVPYAVLPAGQSYRQPTYVTHPWVVTDENDQCLAIFLPDRKRGIAVITTR